MNNGIGRSPNTYTPSAAEIAAMMDGPASPAPPTQQAPGRRGNQIPQAVPAAAPVNRSGLVGNDRDRFGALRKNSDNRAHGAPAQARNHAGNPLATVFEQSPAQTRPSVPQNPQAARLSRIKCICPPLPSCPTLPSCPSVPSCPVLSSETKAYVYKAVGFATAGLGIVGCYLLYKFLQAAATPAVPVYGR